MKKSPHWVALSVQSKLGILKLWTQLNVIDRQPRIYVPWQRTQITRIIYALRHASHKSICQLRDLSDPPFHHQKKRIFCRVYWPREASFSAPNDKLHEKREISWEHMEKSTSSFCVLLIHKCTYKFICVCVCVWMHLANRHTVCSTQGY